MNILVVFFRFGSLMSTEKDESYTVVVKGKALASIKVFHKKSTLQKDLTPTKC